MSEPPANRWADVSRHFFAAKPLDAASRHRYLDHVCDGADKTLRREVEALLAADGRAGEFMTGPVVGPYRLEQPLGSGGMGDVFRAVDTRLGRAVAVKFSRDGFDARFSESRQALDQLIAEYGTTAPISIGTAYSWTGDSDSAFTWLKRAYAQRDTSLPRGLQVTSALKPLRGDARYAALLRKMGLPNPGQR